MLYAFNTIAFGLLCFAWRTDSWVNLFLKVVLFGLAASNGLYPFTPSNLDLEQVDALVKALETLPKFDADAASMLLTCWKFA